ncbi:hypothetical protein HK096_006868, partial [Nowakowskiella sp. JEL0078]
MDGQHHNYRNFKPLPSADGGDNETDKFLFTPKSGTACGSVPWIHTYHTTFDKNLKHPINSQNSNLIFPEGVALNISLGLDLKDQALLSPLSASSPICAQHTYFPQLASPISSPTFSCQSPTLSQNSNSPQSVLVDIDPKCDNCLCDHCLWDVFDQISLKDSSLPVSKSFFSMDMSNMQINPPTCIDIDDVDSPRGNPPKKPKRRMRVEKTNRGRPLGASCEKCDCSGDLHITDKKR